MNATNTTDRNGARPKASRNRFPIRRLSLNGEWDIIERQLSEDVDMASEVLITSATLSGAVPGDVNDALVRSGRLPEPLTGTNFRQFKWVEERSWWYRKVFDVPAEWKTMSAVELSLDGLDVHADIWLNRKHIGHHASAFYPFVKEVRKSLAYGKSNTLLVRLTTGAEHAPARPNQRLIKAVPDESRRGFPERGEPRRVYLRKPAFVWGWDWAPHLATCGITGSVTLRAMGKAEIRDVALTTRLEGVSAEVQAMVEIEYDTVQSSAFGDVEVALTDADGCQHSATAKGIIICSGVTYVPLTVKIPNARLWWPNGSGEPHLYAVTVKAEMDGDIIEAEPFSYGVRTVSLDAARGRFQFLINGRPVFMKGGNWVPCDSLYGRITPDKVTALVEEAAEAHFNCLRIWGGGRYEMDAFYDACDRLGILVWQDFMSACAPLPANQETFRREFMAEAEYQVRRLKNRTCLLLWCGNNEVQAAVVKWGYPKTREPGWDLYFRLLPRLVGNLVPQIPYWPTSPYGGVDGWATDGVGDSHHWVVMNPDPKFWSWPEYWDEKGRPIFCSEYGYGGPCSLESTRNYLGMQNPDFATDAGREHTNTFYGLSRVNHGIKEHYTDPDGLPLEQYILYGGLCQGLNLGYSLESLRANEQTMGGIIWMYNDAWGENGWTIVDYYLRRKISYYNVKRCLAPQRLVIRQGGQAFGGHDGELVLVLVNDCQTLFSGTVRFGVMRYDGTSSDLREVTFHVDAGSRAMVASCPKPDAAALETGTVVAIPTGGTLDPVTWRHRKFRDMVMAPANVGVERLNVCGDDLCVTVSSDGFAHAVHFNVPDGIKLSDHYFDLLPGMKKTVTIYGGAGLNTAALKVKSVHVQATR